MLNNDALMPASSPKTSSKQETPTVTPELFKTKKTLQEVKKEREQVRWRFL